MEADYDVTESLDVKGASCPMPVVKTRQRVDNLGTEEVLEVIATDPGSVADIAGWADSMPNIDLIDQIEADNCYRHYLRKMAE